MSKAPAVDYALDIIEYFAIHNCPIGISDISNALNINKNAVSRVLEALIEKNWIYACEENQKKYKLTLRPFSVLSNNVRRNGIVRIATPLLENLNNELGDSVYLGVKSGKNVMYLLHFDSKKEVRINGRVGGEYPLNCSAPGKVLLSYSESDDIVPIYEKNVSVKPVHYFDSVDKKLYLGGKPTVQGSDVTEVYEKKDKFENIILPHKKQMIDIGNSVIVSAFKKAEKNDDIVLRVFNPFNDDKKINLDGFDVEEINLIENSNEAFSGIVDRKKIKTYRIKF